MKNHLIALTLLAACCVVVVGQDIVAFGDSISDSGNGFAAYVKLVLQTNEVRSQLGSRILSRPANTSCRKNVDSFSGRMPDCKYYYKTHNGHFSKCGKLELIPMHDHHYMINAKSHSREAKARAPTLSDGAALKETRNAPQCPN